jgi:hypothetical protein
MIVVLDVKQVIAVLNRKNLDLTFFSTGTLFL